MIKSNNAFGIVPSDLLLKSAITTGLDDLRKNPFILDFLFNWLSQDPITSAEFGDAEKQRAKEWFLKHQIWVIQNYNAVNDPKFPVVAIGLQSSVEDKVTLGDVNYDTSEELASEEVTTSPKTILGPFTPAKYDSATGYITFPSGMTTSLAFVGMVIYDSKSNIGYPIEDVIDDSTISIKTGIKANFTDAYIAYKDNFFVAGLESALFKETYSIKCFAANDPIQLLYLHSVVEFILLRYRQSLLEARGLDSTSLSSGPVYNYKLNENGSEIIWGRDITMTGNVRKYWPKVIAEKMQGFNEGIIIMGDAKTPESLKAQAKNQGWGFSGDFDSIGAK